ncbi:MAG: YcgL domain-containing protein [Gammaproteobacteria bacterium]|nr:YcgL domain-containing protein [Gammaproteobacteria bacterium]
MQLEIYKSSKKDQTYLYVNKPLDQDELPEALINILGDLSFVMELEVTADTKLISEDINEVVSHVLEKGFYLQLPPKVF